MPAFRACSGLVIRCFKRVEHVADWLIGTAGPVFVVLCWILIIFGGSCFFDVVVRDMSAWTVLALLPVFIIVPLNMYGQYYLITHVPPGFPSSRAIQLSPNPIDQEKEKRWSSVNATGKSLWSPERWGFKTRVKPGYEQAPSTEGKKVKKCRKCDAPKPERTHHCSVCKRCVLMMDHHCPWINGCVGLHNQRYFVLFMAWLSIGCWIVTILGYHKFWQSFDDTSGWSAWSPGVLFTLTWVLCVAMGLAVPVLCASHLIMVAKNETSIEGHDNAYLESRAKAEGLIYLNPYDVGRRRNLQLFFNLGPEGYSNWTLLFPFVIPPAYNGWNYPKRSLPTEHAPVTGLHAPELAEGLMPPSQGHDRRSGETGRTGPYVMGDDGSLTDDEEGGGGYMD